MPDSASTTGFFLSFEGIDGSGKGTQIDLLVEHLNLLGLPVVVNREPGGTCIGQQIRTILLDAANTQLRPTAELLLYFASRAQAIDEVILPGLAEGKVVISDRFTDSTLAYQGIARGLGTELVQNLENIACRGVAPDLTILLDVRPETSLQRTSFRNLESGSKETRMDDESLEFHTRVRDGYLEMAAAEPQRFLLIDGEKAQEKVATDIRDAVLPRIPSHLLKG